MTVLEQLAKVMAESESVPVERVVPAAFLQEDLGLDWRALGRLSVALEDHFEIFISEDHLLTVNQVAHLVNLIEHELSRKEATGA